jgi:serine/threonine-protein kinase
MEYVDGEPLSSTLAREGPLEPARVAAIARQVAEALAAAHALGIVHRDLKPDNVMLAVGRDGREGVKVVDFGIAKAMEGLTQQVTKTGFRIGTPAYMSPEQIRGDTLDGRSDLYSLGCILFELLTGHPPFEGEVGEIVVGRRLTEQPPHPRDLDAGVPKALDEITVRLLARSPDDRFASAEDLLATLAATPVG